MAKKKKPMGRPKGPQDKLKKAFSTKLDQGLIERIKERALTEGRSKNNLVEFVLNENI